MDFDEIYEIELLPVIKLYRKHVLKTPRPEDMIFQFDMNDGNKLQAMDKLLRATDSFYDELSNAGLYLQMDRSGTCPIKNTFFLKDVEYADQSEFRIEIRSNWLNPNYPKGSLHDFTFDLLVSQDVSGGDGEIADWIRIKIRQFPTFPMSFASNRQHVKNINLNMQGLCKSYFHDIFMAHVNGVEPDGLSDAYNFKTIYFVQAIDDICKVLQKIALRKRFLATEIIR